MANKTLNTRIRLKYDTLANWTNTDVEGQGANLILLAGELGICYVPANQSADPTVTTAPTVLFKVGDGEHTFAQLPWASAKAADVAAWAKATTKPTYGASEITGLRAFVEEYSDIDTNTTYRIVSVTTGNVVTGYKLQKHDLTDGADVWTDVSGSTIDIMTDAEAAAIADAQIAAVKGVAGGLASLDSTGKVPTAQLPDVILGQVLFGGNVTTGAVATLTPNAKSRLGTTSDTITLTNDTTPVTGYGANDGIYYIADATISFAGYEFQAGDWLISIGTAWKKIDNTDAVTGVKGNAETDYRLGNVNITPANIGVEDGAEVNIIETVKVNGVALTPDENRAVNVEIAPLVPATTSTLGGVKIGDGLRYDDEAKISTIDSIDQSYSWVVDEKYKTFIVNPYDTDIEELVTFLDSLTYSETVGPNTPQCRFDFIKGQYERDNEYTETQPMLFALDLSKFGNSASGKCIIASSLQGVPGSQGSDKLLGKLLFNEADTAANRAVLSTFLPEYASYPEGALEGFIEKSVVLNDLLPYNVYNHYEVENNFFVCKNISSNINIILSTFVPYASPKYLEKLFNGKINAIHIGENQNSGTTYTTNMGKVWISAIPQGMIDQGGDLLILDCGDAGISNS